MANWGAIGTPEDAREARRMVYLLEAQVSSHLALSYSSKGEYARNMNSFLARAASVVLQEIREDLLEWRGLQEDK